MKIKLLASAILLCLIFAFNSEIGLKENTFFDENWIIKCDDGTDQYDGISSFDLSLIDDYIRGTQDPAVFEVSYFLDPSDALDLTKTGITNPTTFTNTPDTAYDPASPTTQTLELHVRVRNINSNCIADPMSFDLTINTVPLLVNLPDVEQCNDNLHFKEVSIVAEW